MAEGPFVRLDSEMPDDMNGFYIHEVTNERVTNSIEKFRNRLLLMIKNHLLHGYKEFRLRGSDIKDEQSMDLVREVISEAVAELQQTATRQAFLEQLAVFDQDALFEKVAEGCEQRVLSQQSLDPYKFIFDLKKVK